ncbi:MAG: tRNA lysidine(34) synthetase TilS, partial [Selenomonadales bacterium]|nr:tRNA lysidine(34) synthetase TilS [Selenomonadales bacterium]
MRDTVKRTLLSLEKDRPLIAAVSGGVDSLVLLHLLTGLRDEMGLRLFVCHIDHAMRDVSADDARYVADLCENWGVTCHTERVDVWRRVKETGESPEEAARNLRYGVLRSYAETLGGAYIVLAHHAGDQAETVLLHLLRGSGTTGLGGMRVIGKDLVRPLLSFTKDAIEAYAREHNIIPREDETNSDTTYLRNRVRHELLPELSSYQP